MYLAIHQIFDIKKLLVYTMFNIVRDQLPHRDSNMAKARMAPSKFRAICHSICQTLGLNSMQFRRVGIHCLPYFLLLEQQSGAKPKFRNNGKGKFCWTLPGRRNACTRTKSFPEPVSHWLPRWTTHHRYFYARWRKDTPPNPITLKVQRSRASHDVLTAYPHILRQFHEEEFQLPDSNSPPSTSASDPDHHFTHKNNTSFVCTKH